MARHGFLDDTERHRAFTCIHAIGGIDRLWVLGASKGMPSGATAPATAYRPRCADEELVYRIVAEELDEFLAEAEARGHPLPSFFESTFRDFRVLSLPFLLRYRLAYDRTLATSLLAAFLRAVFASLGRRVRECYGVRNTKCGAFTFLQRFGGALNLNVRFHSLLLDGVYEVLPNNRGVRFLELRPPDSQEVIRVLADTVKRLVSPLVRRGHRNDATEDGEDDLSRDHPVMAALYAAAVQGRIAMRPDADQRVVRLGNDGLATDVVDTGSSRCATLAGFSL